MMNLMISAIAFTGLYFLNRKNPLTLMLFTIALTLVVTGHFIFSYGLGFCNIAPNWFLELMQ